MKRFAACLISFILLFGMTACSGDTAKTAKSIDPVSSPVYPKAIAFDDFEARISLREKNPVDESFIAGLNDFSYETSSLLLKNTAGNSNYSPLSLYYALAMACSGAEGTTQSEILSLLGAGENDELSHQCGNLFRILYTDNEISKLKIANSVWMDSEANGLPYTYKEAFTGNASANFYASLFDVDFSDTKTGTAIGKWIADNTNGTLTPDIKISDSQILSLINTVYFYDEWVDRFDKDLTAPDTFHLADSTDITCDFMNMKYGSGHNFSDGDGYLRSALQLKNSGSMVFILPDEDVSIAELLDSPAKVREIFAGGKGYAGQVTFKIPKFSFDSSFDLVDALKELGIHSAFDETADFSGITDGYAYISGVTQNTHIAIDENGVEASAFSQIQYSGAMPPDGEAFMILDRPFIYGITAPNGTLLFIGVCGNPAVSS